jgi:cytochrome c peroxidase
VDYAEAVKAEAHDELIARGRELFIAKFTAADGAGRPMATQAIIPTKRRRPPPTDFQRLSGPDASACSSCHNDPEAGGAGDFIANAFVSEGFESADFDTTDPQFSNERGTVALHGSGLIELLAREMTADLKAQRSAALGKARSTDEMAAVSLETKGVVFGRLTVTPDGLVDVSGLEGIDSDLTIRPFSQKGVFASLRQFTVNAANDHHGMQATERFGALWTGSDDFDEDGVANELSRGDISALVAFQASMPPPERRDDLPKGWAEASKHGEALFAEIGCASCHRPSLPLKSLSFADPGPREVAGTLRDGEVATPIRLDLSKMPWAASLERDADGNWLIPLFGDLKRHVIAGKRVDALGQELLAQRFVERNASLTSELWGIAATAPYGHRGDLTTLAGVIEAHGGEALESRDRFVALGEEDRSAIIAFLKSLTIVPSHPGGVR